MLKENVVYRMLTSAGQEMGFALNGAYYGHHFANRGPIPLENKGFEMRGDVLVRLKDGCQFRFEELDRDLEDLLVE